MHRIVGFHLLHQPGQLIIGNLLQNGFHGGVVDLREQVGDMVRLHYLEQKKLFLQVEVVERLGQMMGFGLIEQHAQRFHGIAAQLLLDLFVQGFDADFFHGTYRHTPESRGIKPRQVAEKIRTRWRAAMNRPVWMAGGMIVDRVERDRDSAAVGGGQRFFNIILR